MNPICFQDDSLEVFVYDYLKKRGYNNSAEVFKQEANVTGKPAIEYDYQPNGFLSDWWSLFNDEFSKKQMITYYSQASIWNYTPQECVPRFLGGFPSTNSLSACDFSSDGQIVASGGIGTKVFLCYMDTSDAITTSEGHILNISDVRFLPGTTIFATSSSDKTVKLWDATKPGKVLASLVGHNGYVKSLDFNQTEGVLASSDTFDVIELWNVSQCTRMKHFMGGGQQIRFQPGYGKLLAVANGKFVDLLDIQTWGLQNRLQGHLKDVVSICWDKSGQMVASVSEESARVWSTVVSGHCLYTLFSENKLQSIVFHPRYQNVLIIGGYRCMQLWNPETGNLLTVPNASDQSITGLAASTQNQFIASASSESIVKIWK